MTTSHEHALRHSSFSIMNLNSNRSKLNYQEAMKIMLITLTKLWLSLEWDSVSRVDSSLFCWILRISNLHFAFYLLLGGFEKMSGGGSFKDCAIIDNIFLFIFEFVTFQWLAPFWSLFGTKQKVNFEFSDAQSCWILWYFYWSQMVVVKS